MVIIYHTFECQINKNEAYEINFYLGWLRYEVIYYFKAEKICLDHDWNFWSNWKITKVDDLANTTWLVKR